MFMYTKKKFSTLNTDIQVFTRTESEPSPCLIVEGDPGAKLRFHKPSFFSVHHTLTRKGVSYRSDRAAVTPSKAEDQSVWSSTLIFGGSPHPPAHPLTTTLVSVQPQQQLLLPIQILQHANLTLYISSVLRFLDTTNISLNARLSCCVGAPGHFRTFAGAC